VGGHLQQQQQQQQEAATHAVAAASCNLQLGPKTAQPQNCSPVKSASCDLLLVARGERQLLLATEQQAATAAAAADLFI